MRVTFFFLLILLISISCDRDISRKPTEKRIEIQEKVVHLPDFSADSAYQFIAGQLAFGPRVPGTEAHEACYKWLVEIMTQFADTVLVQQFKQRVYNRNIFEGKNIISSFNPAAKKRILLAAHWDSRPYADHDPDPKNHRTPIDGANDGASGVGVLMELSRLLHQSPLSENLGIDIIFFDLEDYGPPADERSFGDDEFWALGSQYWARNPHQRNYQAQFGILLDMVGAADAVFPREAFSMQYAAWVLDRVWDAASNLGYGHIFVNRNGPPISDDHMPINQVLKIPMIDIIHLDENSINSTFFEQWHTLGDNLSQIDPRTLLIVGQVVTKVVYEAQ